MLFFIKKLGASERVRIHPVTTSYNIPQGSRVYVHRPGVQPLIGILQYLAGDPVPSWVHPPHHDNDSRKRIYVEIPHGEGLVTNVQIYNQSSPIRYYRHDEFRCYVRIRRNTVLVAFLQPYRYPLPEISQPRVYVRLPDTNNTILTGILHLGDGYRPAWLL